MEIRKVIAIYFSPTGGTKKYIQQIAKQMNTTYTEIDLTKHENQQIPIQFSSKDLVIFGAPVYAGRLPQIPGGLFHGLSGNQTPAVFNVTYGNRAYDDALLEEQLLCENLGFVGIAAAAWIAPHTFSNKIAVGRPDTEDMQKIVQFTEQIKQLLQQKDLCHLMPLQLPGHYPYREPKDIPFVPYGSKACTKCLACVKVCPVQAIPETNPRQSNKSKCIHCLACVHACPAHARRVTHPLYKIAQQKLEKNLIHQTKQAETFFSQTS